MVCKHRQNTHCILDRECRSQEVLELVTDKWTVLVLYVLSEHIYRYGALQRELPGISQKMLSQTLRGLEQNGLVKREIYPVVPPKVEYCLTALGKTLVEALRPLCTWAEQYMESVEEARRAFLDQHCQGQGREASSY